CVMGVNGNLYESDGKTLNFTAVPVKGMLSVWQNLVKDGYTTTDVFADAEANRTNFKAGHVAMHIAPASRWIEAGEILGSDNVGIMPIPGTDTNGSISYIHGAVIPKASDKQELAIKF
ncbi:extracellular solute-binding protein, partial [Clostridioides difficile]|nr:extracellular solute-binding protein [Clostridioides difficile]